MVHYVGILDGSDAESASSMSSRAASSMLAKSPPATLGGKGRFKLGSEGDCAGHVLPSARFVSVNFARMAALAIFCHL
jgi:hypothetical protein